MFFTNPISKRKTNMPDTPNYCRKYDLSKARITMQIKRSTMTLPLRSIVAGELFVVGLLTVATAIMHEPNIGNRAWLIASPTMFF